MAGCCSRFPPAAAIPGRSLITQIQLGQNKRLRNLLRKPGHQNQKKQLLGQRCKGLADPGGGQRRAGHCFPVNDSPAANTLYEQLPLSIQIEDYSHNEKIFYPPNELDTSQTPLAEGPAGTLAYYAPWGNVVLYYGESGGASGLYELGEAVSSADQIESLSGEIQIDVVENN